MLLTSTLISRKVCMAAAIFSVSLFVNAQDFEPNEDGLIVIEAENYTSIENASPSSDWDEVTEPDGYSGEGAMQALPVEGDAFPSADDAEAGSAYLSYSINFTNNGIHYLWARANRTGGGDDSFHYGIDGEVAEAGEFINFENSIDANPDSADAVKWVWISTSGSYGDAGFVEIPNPGTYNLDIFVRETEFKIDKIVLSRNPEFQPSDDEELEETPVGGGSTSIFNVNQNDNLGLRSYPSPFTDQTTIAYNLRSASNVSVKVYSIDGSEVANLFDGQKQAGQQTITWTPENSVPQGIYFIQLQTDHGSQSIKTIKTN